MGPLFDECVWDDPRLARPSFSPPHSLVPGGEASHVKVHRQHPGMKSGKEKANSDFPSFEHRTMTAVCGEVLKFRGWRHGQWVQLVSNATTAKFLHTSDVIPQVRSLSAAVMKLCHFDAAAGFTFSQILSPWRKSHIRGGVTRGRRLVGTKIRSWRRNTVRVRWPAMAPLLLARLLHLFDCHSRRCWE